jgi:hypothetical protein
LSDHDAPRPSEAQQKRLARLGGAMVPGIILCVVAGYARHQRFFPAFLAASVFVTAMAVGALVFVLGQHGTGARHAARSRRPMEWLGLLVSYTFVSFFVVFLASRYIWAWWPTAPSGGWMARWFRTWPFGARMFLYLIAWTVVAAGYAKGARRLDKATSPGTSARLRALAWPMLGFVYAVACAAAGDWVLGLHVEALRAAAVPFAGLYLVADGAVSALAVLAIVTLAVRRAGLLPRLWSDDHQRRVAGWLAISVVVWAAAAAATVFGVRALAPATFAAWRGHWLAGSWETVTFVALGAHLVGLVVLALARGSARALAIAAGVLLLGGAVDAYQLVMPAHAASGLPSWIDLGAFAGALSLPWMAVVMAAAREPLYAVHDAALEDAA